MNDPIPSKRALLQAAIARITGHRDGRRRNARERFRAATGKLRSHLLDDFKRNEWPRFQMLNEIFEKDQGLPVPTLSVCGEGTAEVRFTKLLAYFFDSRNPHGLGGLLTRAVFAPEFEDGENMPFAHCTAQSEVWLGVSQMSDNKEVNNYLDIQVTVGDVCIMVEQKINSGEGEDQLPRYTKRVSERENAKCFFLTPEGKTGKDKKWQSLSHRDLFCRMASVLNRHALSTTILI